MMLGGAITGLVLHVDRQCPCGARLAAELRPDGRAIELPREELDFRCVLVVLQLVAPHTVQGHV
jgi:hypothetical protein